MDDDFFDDDDGLDDLPPNTLQELENRARLSTQHAQPLADAQKAASSDYGFGDDEEVIDLDARPHANVLTARQPSQHASAHPLSQRRVPLPTTASDEVTQRERWRAQRYGATNQHRLPAFKPPRASIAIGQAFQASSTQTSQANGRVAEPEAIENHDDSPNPDIEALRARITALEERNALLTKENEDVNAQAYAKAGEIAIVRANQEKLSMEYEQKLSSLQEQYKQEAAKHRTEMEASKKDREKMETNNKFLEHDLAQEANRARSSKVLGKGGYSSQQRGRTVASPTTTPKKAANLPFRDGFNDDEVMVVSPSRSKEKSKSGTPRAASKRKRPEQERSPANQLSFNESEGAATISAQNTPPSALDTELALRAKEEIPDERFDLVQLVLEHRLEDDRRTIEHLNKFSFPSTPEVSISSHVYDALGPPNSSEDAPYSTQILVEILHLWLRCLQEQLHQPVAALMDLFKDVLMECDDQISASMATRIIPIAVQTADLVATPKARAWTNPTMNEGPSPEIQKLISPLKCLALLHLVTLNCFEMPEVKEAFWSSMEQDFVLIMLHKAQPIADSITMLQLLDSSVLVESFGTITAAADGADPATRQRQKQNEYNLVSRLANLLVDRRDQQDLGIDVSHTPHALSSDDSDEDHFNTVSAYDLRLAAIGLLSRLCSTQHGGTLLASHRTATGRLVRLLHESLVSMYNCDPHSHASAVACVNHSVMLLAHLCFTYSETLDLRNKLAAEPGGHHKHLVSLSRVAFVSGESEIEEGVWSETSEAAHRMLDEFLSPEEGEAVVRVFSSGRPEVG